MTTPSGSILGIQANGVSVYKGIPYAGALFAGFSHIFRSFGLKKAGAKNWIWTPVGGVLLIICGIMLISMPLMGAFVLVEMAGIFASKAFIIAGFTELAAALSDGGK